MPEAVVNFVALLGWSPPSDGAEVMSMQQLERAFSLERVHKGGAAVSRRKLEWLNTEHCARLLQTPAGRSVLAQRWLPYVARWTHDEAYAMRVLETIHSRLSVYGEIVAKCAYFFTEPSLDGEEAVAFRAQVWAEATSPQWLRQARVALEGLPQPWTPEAVLDVLRATQLPFGKLQALLRYALTGTRVGAALNDTIVTLGPDVVARRLDAAR